MLYILNGQLIQEKESNIPITDKVYFFDFAIYKSLKIIKGKVITYIGERRFPKANKRKLFRPRAAVPAGRLRRSI